MQKMRSLLLIFFLLPCIGAGIPPLSENVQIRLETAVDGRDSQGEAFQALLEDVRSWRKPFGVAGTALNSESLTNDPAMYRGSLIRWSGLLEQARDASSWVEVQELFVRGADGTVFIIFVEGAFNAQQGDAISGVARFYKTISLEGRDSKIRVYPTLVTTSLAVTTSEAQALPPQMLFLLPVLFVGILIVFVLARLLKPRREARHAVHIRTDEVIDAMDNYESDLPDNASQALEQLFERAEGKS
jgi:hypothetical protein